MSDLSAVPDKAHGLTRELIDKLGANPKEMRAMIYVVVHPDHTATIDWAGDCSRLIILGALELMKHEILESM